MNECRQSENGKEELRMQLTGKPGRVVKFWVVLHVLNGPIATRLVWAVDSTDRGNTLSELLCWGLILQGPAWSFVQLSCNCAEFCLGMHG